MRYVGSIYIYTMVQVGMLLIYVPLFTPTCLTWQSVLRPTHREPRLQWVRAGALPRPCSRKLEPIRLSSLQITPASSSVVNNWDCNWMLFMVGSSSHKFINIAFTNNIMIFLFGQVSRSTATGCRHPAVFSGCRRHEDLSFQITEPPPQNLHDSVRIWRFNEFFPRHRVYQVQCLTGIEVVESV